MARTICVHEKECEIESCIVWFNLLLSVMERELSFGFLQIFCLRFTHNSVGNLLAMSEWPSVGCGYRWKQHNRFIDGQGNDQMHA